MATKNVTENVLTNKVINALRKKANEYRDSFKNACSVFLELSATDKDAKKVCTYLGITKDALSVKNRKDTIKNVCSKFPLYYTKEGQDTYFPARLQKINKNAGIDAFIAVPDNYISALLNLAKILSAGNEYDQRKLNLTIASVDEAADAYTEESVEFVAYNKEGNRVEADTKKYISFLNTNRLANNAAKIAKSAFFNQTKNTESETSESEN